jgi:hypothetical protein
LVEFRKKKKIKDKRRCVLRLPAKSLIRRTHASELNMDIKPF